MNDNAPKYPKGTPPILMCCLLAIFFGQVMICKDIQALTAAIKEALEQTLPLLMPK